MATIRDVARRAGVSHTAVSAVINGKTGRVSEETSERIRASIRDLSFTPNRIARQLVTGKFDTIAVCFERGNSSHFIEAPASRILGGFADMAEAKDMSILLIPPSRTKGLEPIITSMPSKSVDGAIVIGPITDDPNTIRTIENCLVPLVAIESNPGLVMTSTVDTDNAAGIRNVVLELASQGHSQFLFLGPDPTFQCFVDRARGFTEAIQQSGAPLTERSLRFAQPNRIRDLVDEALKEPQPPTVFVCADSPTGTTVLDALGEAGVRIPEDVSVVVSDGIDSKHKNAHSIVSVFVAYREMGCTAFRLLNELMTRQRKEPAHIKVAPQIIMPGSQP